MGTRQDAALSETAYLDFERRSGERHEFLRGEVFAMTGASYRRNQIVVNAAFELNRQLKTGPCRVLTNDMRVRVDRSGLYTYPDIVIHCDEPVFARLCYNMYVAPLYRVHWVTDNPLFWPLSFFGPCFPAAAQTSSPGEERSHGNDSRWSRACFNAPKVNPVPTLGRATARAVT
ncbi:MAG: Uma2 family endonuclease [Gammaproteobacteria bacterium]